MEIWKDVKGYEGLYMVSDLGRVKSVERYVKGRYSNTQRVKEKIKTQSVKDNGYLIVSLYKNNKSSQKYVHRLVAEAFIPNPDNLPEVNHKDGNKQNNCINNLEWCTSKENNWHRYHVLHKCWSSDKKVLCIETGVIYNSITSASQATNIDNGSISKVCHNKRKTAGGFHWRFYNELS